MKEFVSLFSNEKEKSPDLLIAQSKHFFDYNLWSEMPHVFVKDEK